MCNCEPEGAARYDPYNNKKNRRWNTPGGQNPKSRPFGGFGCIFAKCVLWRLSVVSGLSLRRHTLL